MFVTEIKTIEELHHHLSMGYSCQVQFDRKDELNIFPSKIVVTTNDNLLIKHWGETWWMKFDNESMKITSYNAEKNDIKIP